MDFNALLKGRKTYIVAALFALATFLRYINVIDENTFKMIEGVLLPAGLAALRAGIKRENCQY